jgi:hypothetical protein
MTLPSGAPEYSARVAQQIRNKVRYTSGSADANVEGHTGVHVWDQRTTNMRSPSILCITSLSVALARVAAPSLSIHLQVTSRSGDPMHWA